VGRPPMAKKPDLPELARCSKGHVAGMTKWTQGYRVRCKYASHCWLGPLRKTPLEAANDWNEGMGRVE